jgi:hypothetical protein
MRRRLRERKRERETRLLDLGALVYELHRQGKRAPELLQEKAAELALVDQEVRELEAALDGGAVVDLNDREPESEPESEFGDAEETHEADALELDAEGELEPGDEAEAEAAHPEDEADGDGEEPRP